MNNFSISCQHSKIESNKSFYGSFCLGSFDPSLSITIANSLRRVLLSEINGLGIVSVQIQGVSHEYSNLDGVHEPILDILLNLKELILKKTVKNFRPQIAYLNVRGPGIIRASNIIFPSCIQCVEPNQYIATLSENGSLNMKIYINYGNKWLMSSNKIQKNIEAFSSIKNSNDSNYKKRTLIIKKLIELGLISSRLSKADILKKGHSFSQKSKKLEKTRLLKLNKLAFNASRFYFTKKSPSLSNFANLEDKNLLFSEYKTKNLIYPNIFLEKRIKITLKKTLLKLISLKNIDNSKISSTKLRNKEIKYQLELKNNFQFNNNNNNQEKRELNQVPFPKGEGDRGGERNPGALKLKKITNKNYFLTEPNSLTIDSIFNPINKVNYVIEINDSKTSLNLTEKASTALEFYNLRRSLNYLKTRSEEFSLKSDNVSSEEGKSFEIKKDDLSTLFELKEELNSLKMENIKHNIILEIWTNGSIHPRDALYQAFKKLIKTFSVLHKINPFINSSFETTINKWSNKLSHDQKYLLKQTKFNNLSSQFDKNLIPLNEKYFIETYLSPNIKNFYFNDKTFSNLLNKNLIINEIIETNSKLNREENKLSTPKITKGNGEERNPQDLNNEPINNKIILDRLPNLNKSNNFDISYLKFSLRTYTVLKRLDINTIKDLLVLLNTNLNNSKYKNLNKNIISEIKNNLLKSGFS